MLEGLEIPANLQGPLENLINAVLILIFGLAAMKVLLHVMRKTLEKSTMDQVLYNFILKIVKILLWVVLAILIMEQFGFKASSLLTVLAAAGAAIALALKDSLANVAGGIMIMVNKPFIQDDYVDINGNLGCVKEIDLFVTHLYTYDNKVITIPNGLINTSILINYTKENLRRVDCSFGIGYQDDIVKVKELLADLAASDGRIMDEPGPVIGVAGHMDNCVMIDLKVWCSTDDYWDVKYYLEEEVKLAFDREGITIPYPQMDIHIINDNG